MSIVEMVSLCMACIATVCAMVCLAYAVTCLRFLVKLTNQTMQPVERNHYVEPLEPWPRSGTPDPSPTVFDNNVAVIASDENVIPRCIKCGNKMEGPTRIDMVNDLSRYVYACCGEELKIPVS